MMKSLWRKEWKGVHYKWKGMVIPRFWKSAVWMDICVGLGRQVESLIEHVLPLLARTDFVCILGTLSVVLFSCSSLLIFLKFLPGCRYGDWKRCDVVERCYRVSWNSESPRQQVTIPYNAEPQKASNLACSLLIWDAKAECFWTFPTSSE